MKRQTSDLEIQHGKVYLIYSVNFSVVVEVRDRPRHCLTAKFSKNITFFKSAHVVFILHVALNILYRLY